MDIVRFTAGASAGALAGSRRPKAIDARVQRWRSCLVSSGRLGPCMQGTAGLQACRSSHGFRQACPGQQPDGAGAFRDCRRRNGGSASSEVDHGRGGLWPGV